MSVIYDHTFAQALDVSGDSTLVSSPPISPRVTSISCLKSARSIKCTTATRSSSAWYDILIGTEVHAEIGDENNSGRSSLLSYLHESASVLLQLGSHDYISTNMIIAC